MTNQWTNKILWGYATRDKEEAKAAFRKRHGKEATIIVVQSDQISCHYFLGPVEDSRHDKR